MRNGRLSRTTTSAPPRDTISAASGTRVRARSFSEAATLSSRSRMIASAPRLAAPSTKRRCVTGTNSSDRQTGRFLLCITTPLTLKTRPRAAARVHPLPACGARDLKAHRSLPLPACGERVGVRGEADYTVARQAFQGRLVDAELAEDFGGGLPEIGRRRT